MFLLSLLQKFTGWELAEDVSSSKSLFSLALQFCEVRLISCPDQVPSKGRTTCHLASRCASRTPIGAGARLDDDQRKQDVDSEYCRIATTADRQGGRDEGGRMDCRRMAGGSKPRAPGPDGRDRGRLEP